MAALLKQKRLRLAWSQSHRCAYCDRFCTREIESLDHIIPRALGGTNRLENLVMACRACNQKRAVLMQQLLDAHSGDLLPVLDYFGA